MATLTKKWKLAALNKVHCEEHPRSNLAQNTNVPRSQEDYITQVSVEIEDGVTKKLSQEFSRTENRILGALSCLDEFPLNPLIQGHSGTTPETSRNVLGTNHGTNKDVFQSDPYPEARVSQSQTMQNSGLNDRYDSTDRNAVNLWRAIEWISCHIGLNFSKSGKSLARLAYQR